RRVQRAQRSLNETTCMDQAAMNASENGTIGHEMPSASFSIVIRDDAGMYDTPRNPVKCSVSCEQVRKRLSTERGDKRSHSMGNSNVKRRIHFEGELDSNTRRTDVKMQTGGQRMIPRPVLTQLRLQESGHGKDSIAENLVDAERRAIVRKPEQLIA